MTEEQRNALLNALMLLEMAEGDQEMMWAAHSHVQHVVLETAISQTAADMVAKIFADAAIDNAISMAKGKQ